LLKFLHTLGAAGLTGAVAAMALVLLLARDALPSGDHLPLLLAMAKVAAWILAPSMLLTVVTGLLAMIVTQGFQNAGWVWIKAATGLLVLEGVLHVIGPLQEEAKRGGGDPASLERLLQAEANTLWVLLGVSILNIALGVWRPRLPKYPVS